MKLSNYATMMILFVATSLISGCATPSLKKAIHLSPEFQNLMLNEIIIVPIIDSRLDKEIEVNLEKQLRDPIKAILEGKGYIVSISNSIDGISNLTEDDLKSEGRQIIRQLKSSSSRRVLVILLVDVTTKLTFGSTGSAEVSGFMYDMDSNVIWHDKGVGKMGQGGLIGMLMKGAMAESAISIAVSDLIASVPKYSK